LFYSNSSSWETEYGSVLGYLKTLNENLHDLRRIMIDQTGVGETFMSMAINSGLENARGIVLSQPKKQDVMTFLKHRMEDGLVHIPYDTEFMNELNVERFGLEITGRLKFSHPPGTHDDRLWAFALAVYYARLEPTEYPSRRRSRSTCLESAPTFDLRRLRTGY